MIDTLLMSQDMMWLQKKEKLKEHSNIPEGSYILHSNFTKFFQSIQIMITELTCCKAYQCWSSLSKCPESQNTPCTIHPGLGGVWPYFSIKSGWMTTSNWQPPKVSTKAQ